MDEQKKVVGFNLSVVVLDHAKAVANIDQKSVSSVVDSALRKAFNLGASE